MKICFLAGANSVHSHRWIRYFADKGCEIHWISLMPPVEPVSKGISYYDFGPLSTNPVKIFIQSLRIRMLIKKIKPDILHVHSAGTYGLIGALANFHPLVITIWGSDVLLSRGLKRGLVRFVLGKADLLTCDGDNTEEAIISLGVKPGKIERNYWGVDIKKFKPESPDDNLKKKFFSLNPFIIISIRNFEPIYDIESLIEAIPGIISGIPEAEFIIAGRGTREGHLRELSGSLGVLQKIRFVGNIPSNELPKYFNIADIYVSTSLSDSGLAASTAEAMACGLPVVITDFGDNRKWVKDGENGFVVPVKNPEKLAEKIVYVLKDQELRERMSRANRKTIEEKNNYYTEMEKMVLSYEKILTKSQKGVN